METDFIAEVGKSLIQHGFFNNRIYLISFHPDDLEKIIERIQYLQLVYSYEKIIIKIPRSFERDFITSDTRLEAVIPGYYQGREDALFLSRFFKASRSDDDAYFKIKRNIQSCKNNAFTSIKKTLNRDIILRKAIKTDIPKIAQLYQRVFETYPFPIYDHSYLKKIIESGIPFFVAETLDGIIAAGSCETDSYASAAEMSDIAVDPKFRGYSLSKMILQDMEDYMVQNQIKTLFSICRAEPIQINRLFAGFGYENGGTLIKNTNICGKCESMNIWYKQLRR